MSAESKGNIPANTSAQWLQVTLASIGDGVITIDADAKVTFLNAVAEKLTDRYFLSLSIDQNSMVRQGEYYPFAQSANCRIFLASRSL